MGSFAPSTSYLVTGNDISDQTYSFIQGADSRSLTATIYQPSYDANLLSKAGRVIFNMGALSSYESNNETDKKIKEFSNSADALRRQGVDVRQYSSPENMRRIHMKTYTASFQGRPEAFVSTGNLSESGLSTLTLNRRQRIKDGEKVQHNLGLRIKDPNIVRQLAEIQSDVSLNKVPKSRQNVLVGTGATDSVTSRLRRAKKGDKIVLSSPYLDNDRVIDSLLTAKEAGADVTVISSYRGKGAEKSGSAKSGDALDALSSRGITVLTPTRKDPLLVHTKALAIKSGSQSSLYLGSHNLTDAATRNDSIDILVNLNDEKLTGQVYSELTKFSKDAGLIKHKTVNQKTSRLEYRMSRRGLSDLYKVKAKSKNETGKWVSSEASMPNYPTKMSGSYFGMFSGKDLPKISLYQDLWEARTDDKDTPDALIRMDKEMSNPGLGMKFNYLVGSNVYQEDKGVIGSSVIYLAKAIDNAFGSSSFRESEAERKGDNKGTINKLLGMSSAAPESAGPFEKIATQLHAVLSGAALTMVTYISIDLPLKYVKAKFTSDFFDHALRPQGLSTETKGLDTSIRIARKLVFGQTTSDFMNQFEKEGGYDYMEKSMAKEYSKRGTHNAHPNRAAEASGKVTRSGLKDFGVANHSAGVNVLTSTRMMRRFDSTRFDHLLRPLFDLINPYSVGSRGDYGSKFQQYTQDLFETIQKMPEIVSKSNSYGGTKNVFVNVGSDQLRQTAVAYDNISSLLPANMLYWTKPTRELFNLPEFDPEKNLTIRDLVSFENAVKWTDEFYEKAGTILKNPAKSLRKVASAWRNEISLVAQEQSLIKDVMKLTDLSAPDMNINAKSTEEILTNLHKVESQVFSSRSEDIDNFLSDARFKKYEKSISKQRGLLQDDIFNKKQSDYYSPNPYKKEGTEARKRVDVVKKNLLVLGALLAVDNLADRFIFKPLGASLTTQIAAHQELETEDGSVARFIFDGTLSRTQALSAQVVGGLAAGVLFPTFSDVSVSPKSIRGLLTDADQYGQYVDQLKDVVKSRGSSKSTQARTDAETAAFGSRGKYALSKANLTEAVTGRSRMKFNSGAALLGAFLGGIAIKTAATVTARVMNWWNDRDGSKLKLSDASGVLAARFEKLSVEAFDNARTDDDYVDATMAHRFAKDMLSSKEAKNHRVYTLASQMTTPFFQLPIVVKVDPMKGKASIGVGIQMMQATGVGFTPLLPIAIRLKPKPADDSWEKALIKHRATVAFQEGSPLKKTVLAAENTLNFVTRNLSGALVMGNTFMYDSDSLFDAGIGFVAASSGILLGAQAVREADPVKLLTEKFGQNHRIVKEFDDLLAYTKPLRKYSEGALGVANKSIRFMYTIPLQMVSSTYLGVHSAIREASSWFVRTEHRVDMPIDAAYTARSKMSRKAAPYILAIAAAHMFVNPEAGTTGEDFKDDGYMRAQAAFTVGGTVGFLLDKTGVFATTDELAEDFRSLMQAKDLDNKKAYGSVLESWMPKVSKSSTKAAQDLTNITEGMIKSKPYRQSSGKKFHFSKALLGEMASPSLWEQGYDRARSSTDSGLSPKSKFKEKLPGGSIKSVGARIAVAALVIGALTTTANAAANLMTDEQLASFYKVPFVGPALRLLSGVEVAKDKLHNKGTDGGAGSTDRGGWGAIAQRLFHALTFKQLGKVAGMYSDTPDAFLNVVGPVGVTFKSERMGVYTQHSTAFSDMSYTAYDLAFNSTNEANYDIYARIEAGKAKTYKQAYAQVRGSKARKSKATHVESNSYEMSALRGSSSLSRAASIRHYKMENQSWQTAQEHGMDYARLAIKFGRSSSVEKTKEQKDYLYNPFSVLKQASVAVITRDKNGGTKGIDGPKDFNDLEKELTTWIYSSESKRSRIVQSYGLVRKGFNSQWSREVSAVPGGMMLASIVGFAHLATTIIGVETMIGGIVSKLNVDELETLAKSSPLNQPKKSVINSYQYRFESAVLPNSGHIALLQVDLTNRSASVYKLPMTLEDINERGSTKFTASQATSRVGDGYNRLHKNLNSTLNSGYGQELQRLVKAARDSTDDAYLQAIQTFRSNSVEMIDLSISRSYKATLGGSPVSLFQVMTGASSVNQNAALEKFMREGDDFLGQSLDSVIEELNDLRSSKFRGVNNQTATFRLNAAFTETSSFKQFYTRLERPIQGTFTDQAYRASTDHRRNKRVLGESIGQDVDEYARIHRQGMDSHREKVSVNSPSRSVKAGATPWSEGFITTGLRSTKSVAGLGARWAFEGVSFYEMTEAALILMGGNAESDYMKGLAGTQLVSSALYAGFGAAIAVGLVAAGVAGLPALALGFVGSFGLDFAKNKLKPLQKGEKALIKAVGSFLSHPVESTANQLDKVGLGSPARFIGMLAGGALQLASSPIRGALKAIVAPILEDQHAKMATDNMFWLGVKTMLLPNSVFSNLTAEEGRSTWAGKELWSYGNQTVANRQKQLGRINDAINRNGEFDDDRVHPYLSGGLSSSYEQMISAKYFSSAAGGRIFDPFSAGATYSMSNSLRLAIQRRHSMTDVLVHSAAISKPPDVEDLSAMSVIKAVHRTMSAVQYEDFSTGVLSKLRHNVADTILFTSRQFANVTGWVARQGIKALDLLPPGLRNIDLKIQSGVRFVKSSLKALVQKGVEKYYNPAIRHATSFLERFGVAPAQITVGMKRVKSRFLEVIDSSKRLGYLDALLDVLPGWLDKGISRLEVAAIAVESGLKKIDRTFKIKERLMESARLDKQAALAVGDAIIATGGRIKRFAINMFKTEDGGPSRVADFLAKLMIKVMDSKTMGKAYKVVDKGFNVSNSFLEALYRQSDTSSLIFTRGKGLLNGTIDKIRSSMSVGASTYVALASMDLVSSIFSDKRLESLTRESRFREYEAAYTETSIGITGSVIGSLAAGITKNPLIAITAAVLGGTKIGDKVGAYLSRNAYANRYEEENKVSSYIKQSGTMAVFTTLSKVPEYIKLARAGNVAGVAKRVAFNTLMSFATGGLGPSTQFSLLSYGADSAEFVANNREKLKGYKQQLKSVGREVPDYLNLIFKGKVSDSVKLAADESYQEMVAKTIQANNITPSNLDSVGVSWKGSRWMPDGQFNGSSVELSKSTQSILGRAKLGRYVPAKMLDDAVFTSLHEIAHGLEIKNNLPRLTDLDVTRLAGKMKVSAKELKLTISSMAKESTSFALYDNQSIDNLQNLDVRNAKAIYADEYSATARAFWSMEEQGVGDVNRLYESKVNDYYRRRYDIDDIYQKRMVDAGNHTNNFDYTVRHKPGGSRSVDRKKSMNALTTTRVKGSSVRTVPSSVKKSVGLLDDAFAVGDVLYGVHATGKVRQVSKKYSGKVDSRSLTEASNEVYKARKTQVSSYASTASGIIGSFVLKSGWAGLSLGLAAGVVSELDTFGIAKRYSKRDIERLRNGDSITDPAQSPSVYIRAHRGLLAEKAVVQTLFSRPTNSIASLAKKTGKAVSMISGLAAYGAMKSVKAGFTLVNKASKGRFASIGNRVSTVLKDSNTVKSAATKVSGVAKAIGSNSAIVKSAVFAKSSKLSGLVSKSYTGVGDGIARSILKASPTMGRHIISVGYRESLINALGPALDIATFSSGAMKALRLNSSSSKADVQSAYAQMGSARGSLIGSMFGHGAFGRVGDALGSTAGSVLGTNKYEELANLRYETQDFGAVSVLDDMIQPASREIVLARAAGKAAGRSVSRAGNVMLANSAAKKASGVALSNTDTFVRGVATTYTNSSRAVSQTAKSRLARVLGEEGTETAIKSAARFGRVAKSVGRFGKVVGAAIDPVISSVLLLSAIGKSQTVDTDAENESAIRRSTTSYASFAGFAIGTALAGPVGGAIGATASDLTADRYGKNLSNRASEKGVSSKRIVRSQAAGGIAGAIVGGLGIAALVGAGIVGGTLALPVTAAIVLGTALVGAIAGGELGLSTGKANSSNKREQDDSQTRAIKQHRDFTNRNTLEIDEDERANRLIRASKKKRRKKKVGEKEDEGFFNWIEDGINSVGDAIRDTAASVASRIAAIGKGIKNSASSAAVAVQGLFGGGTGSDISGNSFGSGLFTGPSANIGGSSAYHIDTKLRRGMAMTQQIAIFDQLAVGYAAQGRSISFSNAGVSGEVYSHTASVDEKSRLLSRASAAHSHSVHANWLSFDYYVPTIGNSNHHASTEGAEMLLPNIPGGSISYATSGGYGNSVHMTDAAGNDVLKQGHGDNRRALPADRTLSVSQPTSQASSNTARTPTPSATIASTAARAPVSRISSATPSSTAVGRTSTTGISSSSPPASTGSPFTRTLVNQDRNSITVSFDSPLTFPIQGKSRSDYTVSEGGSFWSPRPARNGIHYGQDFATPTGTNLLAPFAGRVVGIMAPTSSAYANITMETTDRNGNKVQVLYGHVSGVNVSVGQEITAGQLVGRSGGDPGDLGYGSGTGSHLDVKVKVNDRYADPENLFQGSGSLGSPSAGGISSGSVAQSVAAVSFGVGIIDVANQKRRSGGYSAERVALANSPNAADRERLSQSRELVTAAMPTIDNDVTRRGVADRASTYSDSDIARIVTTVRTESAEAERVMQESSDKVNQPVAVTVNTNNPTAESRSSTQNLDTSRPTAITIEPWVELVVFPDTDGSTKMRVEISQGPQHQREWESITGLPFVHDYQSMDSGLGSEY